MGEDARAREGRRRPRDERRPGKLPWERTLIFWLEIAYLGALATLAILYFTDVITPRKLLGPMPIAIPWFGALGGVVISLTGVFDHAYDWEPAQRLWHVSRPFIGATVGVIAVLLLQAGILAAGISPDAAKSGPTSPSIDNLFYYLVAFGVGYREESFRALMRRLLDVILAPGHTGAGAAPTISSLTPSSGPIVGGTSVTLIGTGLADVRSVRFGTAAAQFHANGDTSLSATSPAAAQPGAVQVSVSSPSGSASAGPFTYQ